MLALFLTWMLAAALLDALTVLPRWLCLLLPAIAAIILLFKKPEWF
jgi:presenilin-like A22 family membrane protease